MSIFIDTTPNTSTNHASSSSSSRILRILYGRNNEESWLVSLDLRLALDSLTRVVSLSNTSINK